MAGIIKSARFGSRLGPYQILSCDSLFLSAENLGQIFRFRSKHAGGGPSSLPLNLSNIQYLRIAAAPATGVADFTKRQISSIKWRGDRFDSAVICWERSCGHGSIRLRLTKPPKRVLAPWWRFWTNGPKLRGDDPRLEVLPGGGQELQACVKNLMALRVNVASFRVRAAGAAWGGGK